MDCQELQAYYESYALGVLEGEESVEIRNHLSRGCPKCTPGVAEAQAVVSRLAALAPEAEPPERARRKLLAAVGVEEPRRRRSWIPVLGWAAAAALLILAVIAERENRGLENRMARLQEQFDELAAENESYRRVWGIIAAPGTKAVSLSAPESPQIQAYWNEESGLVLAAQSMPNPSPDRTFQLWIVPKQGNPISVDIFRPDESGRTLLLAQPSESIEDAAALAISDEPAGGSPQPTTEPTWVGTLG